MKAPKLFNSLMVVIFFVATTVPLLAVNKTQGTVSVAENRVLASFPSLRTSEGKINTQFMKEFETWFNDNLGLRDRLVMANTELQYNMFGTLTKTDTIIGKNNWLYYVTPEIIKDYQHLNLPSTNQLKQWGDSLEEINNYLSGKNIPFITMLNLDKKTIYPEYYPETIKKVGNTSRTDMMIDFFHKNTNIDFFTPKEALLKAKSKATVYSPRYDNAHWNYYGAFIGYQELMKRVKAYYPNVKVLSWEDYNITKYTRETKIYNAVKFSEEDLGLNYTKESSATRTFGLFDNMNLNNSEVYTFSNSNKDLPKALVLGDSYFYGFLIPQLSESFSELTFVHSDNIDQLQSFVELTDPDIVIYENVERMWDHTMDVLTNSSQKLVDYSTFAGLPKLKEAKVWIDYFNNEPPMDQRRVVLNQASKTVNIIGWALDSQSVAGEVYLEIGDKFYKGNYGIPRESVAKTFNDNNLTNCGFSFVVNTEDLVKSGKMSIHVISKDLTYQYIPIDISVEVNK
ncbi:alginate O-acetyltransferase [Paenibacillus macerans]|uniref:alginate O-acetyltransferase AlgX-related protein n=1 Tax=Paenibacillus macerans TaxID=44252 RepID=UPI001B0D82F1|nr:hypothetical protein [Paenibacillus macerans]GIP08709.1 alginate O-acetyltransferase [Paenibacillus macerans]